LVVYIIYINDVQSSKYQIGTSPQYDVSHNYVLYVFNHHHSLLRQ